MNTHRVLDERYAVGDLIGRGGMADVHLGHDFRLSRTVAIKLLRKNFASNPLFQSRFRRETLTMARLNHPNIVNVYDLGVEKVEGSQSDDSDVPYIVMEFVPGRTLRELLAIGSLALKETIHHQVGILTALEFSHRVGIVHRDIKPDNVMITPDGVAKVLDFGIARVASDSAETLSETRSIFGTAKYFSPEQARGDIVDARSDLYSAGCLLYELLTGRPPFTGDSAVSIAYQHVHEQPIRASLYNPEVTPALDSVISRALIKARKDRFQSAQAFREALQSAAKGIIHDDGDSWETLENDPFLLTTKGESRGIN